MISSNKRETAAKILDTSPNKTPEEYRQLLNQRIVWAVKNHTNTPYTNIASKLRMLYMAYLTLAENNTTGALKSKHIWNFLFAYNRIQPILNQVILGDDNKDVELAQLVTNTQRHANKLDNNHVYLLIILGAILPVSYILQTYTNISPEIISPVGVAIVGFNLVSRCVRENQYSNSILDISDYINAKQR